MISTRLFQTLQQRGMTRALMASQASFYRMPVRFFSQKEEGEEPAQAEAAEAAEAAPEPAPEPTPAPKKAK